MARRMAIGIALLGAVASHNAIADTPIDSLANALPAGWRLSIAKHELVIRHLAPVRAVGHYSIDATYTGNQYVAAQPSSVSIAVELRYRIEPAWSKQRIADARETNAKVYRELVALRARYRIDEIHSGHGQLLPETPDERQRVTVFESEYAQALGHLVTLPHCTLGGTSLFDSPATYSQLDMMVDPPGVMREAYAIVALVKRRCG